MVCVVNRNHLPTQSYASRCFNLVGVLINPMHSSSILFTVLCFYRLIRLEFNSIDCQYYTELDAVQLIGDIPPDSKLSFLSEHCLYQLGSIPQCRGYKRLCFSCTEDCQIEN